MNTIKQSDVEKELETLRKISSDKTLKPSQKYKLVEDMGYERRMLGTGPNAYTRAHKVEVQNIHSYSARYLRGKYIVYGVPCRPNSTVYGTTFKGYVKLIVD